jgi:hypothetical protein
VRVEQDDASVTFGPGEWSWNGGRHSGASGVTYAASSPKRKPPARMLMEKAAAHPQMCRACVARITAEFDESPHRTPPSAVESIRSVNRQEKLTPWGYVQGLTRLSQRTPWQDGRFALDRAASRLLTTVH